jgi:hypothetical protein
MNLNEMQNAWNSPRNTLPTEQHQKLAEYFTRQMRRRRRFQAAWLVSTFFWLTLITTLAVRMLAQGKVQPAHEWGLFPLLLVPWLFALHFLRSHLKSAPPTHDGELPVVDSLRAALASNRTNQFHLKLVGILYLIVVPALALSMHQLHVVGKASSRELTSMAALFGIALLISGTVITLRFFLRLRPQQRQLNTLLTELNAA